jgi:hypothetical protein
MDQEKTLALGYRGYSPANRIVAVVYKPLSGRRKAAAPSTAGNRKRKISGPDS